MITPTPLILNPSARRGRAGRRAQAIRDACSSCGIETEIHVSKAAGDIAAIAEGLALAGATRIIVAGGDGSVNEALNGIMASGRTVALGLVPTGTGNDFAKACGIDPDWQRAAVALADRMAANVEPAAVDAGRCNEKYFCNGVGIGFDAVVTRYASKVRLPIGDLVYVAGLIRALAKGVVTPELEVAADSFRYVGRATLANIANGPWLGGQFNIAPSANNTDGLLDLVLAEPVSRLRAASLVSPLQRGEHLDEPEVQHARVRTVTVTSKEPIPSHLDGEVQPSTERFEIEVLPGALRLL
jgi:YegS/Rv2252/BmrU family lipid kinase